jgi:TetR/AcrR family transcriptional repressor of nem operon
MRMKPEQKQAARAAIVEAAGRRFRMEGRAGVGIDALAAEAGQTSGAIYAHFGSKAEVFAAVVATGLRRLVAGIERTRASGGSWVTAFAAGYLSRGHRRSIAEGCALPGLSADVARAPADVRQTYAGSLEEAITFLAAGCDRPTPEEQRAGAVAILALAAGGILLSRAVPDGPLADEILDACRKAAATLAGSREASA